MSIAKQLMDEFHEKRVLALRLADFEGAQLWDSCENMVNNLHHGEQPLNWLKALESIAEQWLKDATTDKEKELYQEALTYVQYYTDLVLNEQV